MDASSKPHHIVIVECRGGADKGSSGHRADSLILQQDLQSLGHHCRIVFFTDSEAPLIENLACDAAIFRVNPGQYEGVTLSRLTATAEALEARGAVVLPNFATVSKLGQKSLLWHIKDLEVGLEDTHMYHSREEASVQIQRELDAGETRVLKVVFGSGGNGVFILSPAPGSNGDVSVAYAVDNTQKVMPFEDAMDELFSEASVYVDQRFLPLITDGELRLMMILDRAVEFVHKKPAEGGVSATLFSGAEYTVHPVEDYLELKKWFLESQLPGIMSAVGVEKLPLLWTADFIKESEGRYKLGEINCACVGFSKQPHFSKIMAEVVVGLIEKRVAPPLTALESVQSNELREGMTNMTVDVNVC